MSDDESDVARPTIRERLSDIASEFERTLERRGQQRNKLWQKLAAAELRTKAVEAENEALRSEIKALKELAETKVPSAEEPPALPMLADIATLGIPPELADYASASDKEARADEAPVVNGQHQAPQAASEVASPAKKKKKKKRKRETESSSESAEERSKSKPRSKSKSKSAKREKEDKSPKQRKSKKKSAEAKESDNEKERHRSSSAKSEKSKDGRDDGTGSRSSSSRSSSSGSGKSSKQSNNGDSKDKDRSSSKQPRKAKRKERREKGKKRRRKHKSGRRRRRRRGRSRSRSRSSSSRSPSRAVRGVYGTGDHKQDLDGFISKNMLEARVAHALRSMSDEMQRKVMGTDGGENSYLLVDRVKNPNAVVMSRIRKLERG